MSTTPIIIDTDPGVDDAMAIAYALAHPELELLGLTTVFGNTHVDATTRNALWLLECFGAGTVPVAKGAAVPSVQSPLPHAEFVHGDDGIGNVYSPDSDAAQSAARRGVHASDAAAFIVDSARARPGEITLVAVGPLTNVAEALARESELPNLLHSLVVMGGALDEPGNVTPAAEANFFNDPHAVDVVMSVDWPLTVVGLDVTHQIMINDADLERIGSEGGRRGRLIRESSRFYVDFYSRAGAAQGAAGGPACAMHDAAALVYVTMPDAFERVHGVARTVPDGMAAGQMLLDRKGYSYASNYWNDRAACAVCINVDAHRVREDFITRVIHWGGGS